MQKNWYLLGAMLGTLVLVVFYLLRPPKEVHLHAGFIVYRDGQRIDFVQTKYMNLEKCGEHEVRPGLLNLKKYWASEQIEKAHLHDMVGDVVHVHREGAKWGDLFRNIGYALPKDVQVTGYVNDNKVNNVLDYPIVAYDSVVIVIGDESGINKSERVSVDRIKEVEGMSETCGS